MKGVAALACALWACRVGALGSGELATGAPAAREVGAPDGVVQEFQRLANSHRRTVGCGPLRWDALTGAVAQAHAEDMARRDYFSHKNPEGQGPFDRLRAAGVTYTAAAENLAFGYPTAAGVLRGWLESPGHRRNLESCRYNRHGVGFRRGKWVQVFIRR